MYKVQHLTYKINTGYYGQKPFEQMIIMLQNNMKMLVVDNYTVWKEIHQRSEVV